MEWDIVEKLLFDLGKFIFIVYFLLFLLSVIFERKVSSLVISLMVLAVANGTMTAITPMLYEIASLPGLLYKFLWYAVFVCIDGIAIFLLVKFHSMLRQNVSLIASVIGSAFLVLAVVQSLRFVDRYVSNTDMFQFAYQYGIPLINVILVPVIVVLWILNVKAENRNMKVVMG